MSGLVKQNIINELQTEVLWLRRVVVELSKRLGHTSYAAFILEQTLEPEEVAAFEQAVFRLGPGRRDVSIDDLEARCAEHFEKQTGKAWFMRKEVLTEMFRIHLDELYPE